MRTPAMERAMLDEMLVQKRAGKQTDNGTFRGTELTLIALRVQEAAGGTAITSSSVINKYGTLKAAYRLWRALPGSGWSFSPLTGIEANDESFDEFVRAKKAAERPVLQRFRTEGFPPTMGHSVRGGRRVGCVPGCSSRRSSRRRAPSTRTLSANEGQSQAVLGELVSAPGCAARRQDVAPPAGPFHRPPRLLPSVRPAMTDHCRLTQGQHLLYYRQCPID